MSTEELNSAHDQAVAHAHDLVAAANKPWWQSKKILLAAVSLAIVAWHAYTGKPAASTAEVLDKIQSTAMWLGPLIGLMLSLAHVEGPQRAAAMDFLATLQTIKKPETVTPAFVPVPTPLAPPSIPGSPVQITEDPLTGRKLS